MLKFEAPGLDSLLARICRSSASSLCSERHAPRNCKSFGWVSKT